MHKIEITLTPDELNRIPAKDQTIVMIDTLRASTTIVTALANGARGVIPFSTRSELEEYYRADPRPDYLLCGERGGRALAGFDLGNSPLSYQPRIVKNRIILLKTTNGTRILEQLPPTNMILIGAMVNSLAVTKRIIDLDRDVFLVCAGTQGAFSLEDFITAGRYSSLLQQEGWQGDDLVIAATRIFKDNQSFDDLINLFLHSRNGQNLLNLGYSEDIKFAGSLDLFSVVPYLKGDKIIL